MGIRKVIHVDMDAFYASVEQRDDAQFARKARDRCMEGQSVGRMRGFVRGADFRSAFGYAGGTSATPVP